MFIFLPVIVLKNCGKMGNTPVRITVATSATDQRPIREAAIEKSRAWRSWREEERRIIEAMHALIARGVS